ncbi:hypothetical protein [Algicella marina]|uniref:Ferrochelatase n=1 Tax=Algicella marina TaxID=2683284 RepID=A0A6P1T4N8_9RHOB|nr:hypothetical protein [Algicella marina]QHQ36466.1 hypothetical protein GO499_15425 [Algicella marina]
MKLTATVAAIALLAAPAFAGNVEPFVAPEPVAVDEPVGGSNAAWLVPLIGIAIIGAAVAANQD